MAKSFWLVKSEPFKYSWDQFVKDGGTYWDGVRNAQARNNLAAMKKGDGVLYYHSRTKVPGVVGLARVVEGGHPDPTQFVRGHKYEDAKSDPDDPRWYQVTIEGVEAFEEVVSLETLKDTAALEDMAVVQRGQRLSVQSVTAAEWRTVLRLGGVRKDPTR